MFNFKRLLSILFPPRCPFCNNVISIDEVVCEDCDRNINYKAIKQGITTRDGRSFTCLSPFSYKEPIRSAIHKFKFRGAKSFAVPFGKYAADVLKENVDISKIDYITCVPLDKSRRRTRGFNQSEVFAREITRLTRVKYIELLKKVKKNKIQHELSLSERTENVKDVYSFLDDTDVKDKIIIVCDDILTSGNTMAECAKVLFDAGAKEIIGMTIANVEKHVQNSCNNC